ncbi:MAG: hypothetical protein ABSC89_02135 [Verrucomicrobiota bacterium]|jgi:hypothetical protein
MNPSQHWTQLVNQTRATRHRNYSDAWRITAGAHPDAATLMGAFGRSRQTVQFFNSRQAAKPTPEKGRAQKEFFQFVNEKTRSGLSPHAAYNAAAREHPDLIATMAGGASVQFVNTADGSAPVGSPQFKKLFWLPATATQEQFAAAWVGNGSKAQPLNPAKIFAALVELAQKQGTPDYDAAIARCKSDFPDLWAAVELLSKEPV